MRFIEHIRERKQILWMDWMANVGLKLQSYKATKLQSYKVTKLQSYKQRKQIL